MWKLSNMLLNKQWVLEEIELNKYLDTIEIGNVTHQNL